MYTKEEKETAKALVSNIEYLELIAKVFLETEDKLDSSFISEKTNEELGEVVRANDLAEQKVKTRFAVLKQIGTTHSGTSNTKARE